MISDTQRENLKKLVRFFESLPEDYGNLEMYMWAHDEMEAANATPEHPCGTPACLAGHGPSAGIPLQKHGGSINWANYASRAFGYRHLDFLFGFGWPDSIPEGLARIKLVLANNVPEDWYYSDRFTGEEQ